MKNNSHQLDTLPPAFYTRIMRFLFPDKKLLPFILLIGWLIWGGTSPSLAQDPAPTSTPTALPPTPLSAVQLDALSQAILEHMTPEQRVGQLFLVTFVGHDTGPNSDVARLVRDWHVGGVVLLAANENFYNDENTPAEVQRLTNDLQTFAFRDLNTPIVLPDGKLNSEILAGNAIPGLPLLVAIDHEGDGYPYTRLINGFTPIPNSLAIGATWQPEYARQIGEVVGRELSAVGVNLLLGPSLDVLDNPRPELKGYPASRTFGGDAYWVAQMGKAYITGVHQGSNHKVATVAKHFPGQGASDRRPDREVATVQKPLSSLQQVELVPFHSVTDLADNETATTDALMTSHVRYKGFQENPRQLTPPISLAPELQTIMEGFSDWRSAGGVLVSDALGVRALKRYYQAYEPDRFPTRRVAQEAFLAGNDLLILSQFDRDGIWSAQLANMEDSINFFRQKYEEDPAFRSRVDDSVTRIIRLKLRLYPHLNWSETQNKAEALTQLNQGNDLVTEIARTANTLIFPGATEIADRLPSPPLPDERVLIFTDSRPMGDCPNCPTVPAIPLDALEKIALRLYGPEASDQVRPDLIDSASFDELNTLLQQIEAPDALSPEKRLSDERYTELNNLINGADWIIFAMLDVDQETRPSSAALKRFLDQLLDQRADILRDKKLVVFAFNAPYFLSDTEIAKLTAYYGLYSKTPPFLETAVRTLFRELTPTGTLPVSVTGVNYNLNHQLEPDPTRSFPLLILHRKQGTELALEINAENPGADIEVGDDLILRAGPVLDYNGHHVPDGTPVEFRFLDQQAGVELPRRQASTVDGIATTQLAIERTGVFQLSATAGEGAVSAVPFILTVGGESGASVATATPTTTPTATATPTITPTPDITATPTATITPTPGPSSAGSDDRASGNGNTPGSRTNLAIFILALIANGTAASIHYLLSHGDLQPRPTVLRNLLISVIGAQTIYLLYVLGWFPGAKLLQNQFGGLSVLLLTFLGGLLPFLTDRILTPSALRP